MWVSLAMKDQNVKALNFAVSDCRVPHMDYKQVVSTNLRKLWQSQWDQVGFNKLQAIKKLLKIQGSKE